MQCMILKKKKKKNKNKNNYIVQKKKSSKKKRKAPSAFNEQSPYLKSILSCFNFFFEAKKT